MLVFVDVCSLVDDSASTDCVLFSMLWFLPVAYSLAVIFSLGGTIVTILRLLDISITYIFSRCVFYQNG